MSDESSRAEALFTVADYALAHFLDNFNNDNHFIAKKRSVREECYKAAQDAITYFPRKSLIQEYRIGVDDVARVLREWTKSTKRVSNDPREHLRIFGS